MKYFSFVLVGMLALFCSSASGQVLFGVNGGSGGGYESPGAVLSISQTTGAGAVLGTPMPGLGVTGVATDSQGRVFASTGSTDFATNGPRLIQINPATGALIADVGRLQTAGGDDCYVGDLSFQPGTNVLFGILGNQGPEPRCGIPGFAVGGYLLTIDTSTAQVTVVGRDAAFGNSNGGLAFAPNGTLYFTPCWDDPGSIYTLDPATAAITSSTAFLDSGTCYMGLAVRPTDGTIFASYDYESDDNSIFTLDPVTGARQVVGWPGDYLVHDLTFVNSSASPGEGTIGTEIGIVGPGFGAKKGKVYLGTTALKVLGWNNEVIQCLMTKPLAPSSYDVRVLPKGAAEMRFGNAFSVEAPRIDPLDPVQGGEGTEVTIYGDFFGTKKGKVALGGKKCKVLSWAMKEIHITIPKGLASGTYDLTVTNRVEFDTLEDGFTIP